MCLVYLGGLVTQPALHFFLLLCYIDFVPTGLLCFSTHSAFSLSLGSKFSCVFHCKDQSLVVFQLKQGLVESLSYSAASPPPFKLRPLSVPGTS